MTSDPAAEKAAQFLAVADQFQLGELVTEQPHPRTRTLSETTQADLPAGLKLLLDVDRDVLDTYRKWSESGAPRRIAGAVAQKLLHGGRIFFTGCGATGRLSIQLAAIWRDYWQRRATGGALSPAEAADWEFRAISVMAGGDFALIKSVEGFEDYAQFGKKQIEERGVSNKDVVFAITEGGETSFVIGTAWKAVEAGAQTYFVYNNPDSLLREHVKRSREILDTSTVEKINLTTGPMAITGSTRMQATSIQLCVMIVLLEMILQQLRGQAGNRAATEAELTAIPGAFLSGLEQIHATLQSDSLLQQLAALVRQEENVHRQKQRNNYFADRLGIDVLTDTTERSPTFSLPSFRKAGDAEAAESTSFLFLPHSNTEAAWTGLLKRDIQAVEWDREALRQLIGDANINRQYRVVQAISRNEILRFRIGIDGLADRPFRPGDSATAFITEHEIDLLTEADGFYRTHLEQAAEKGASTAIVFLGSRSAIARLTAFLDTWPIPALRVLVPLPETNFCVNGHSNIAAKFLLNALSTATMVRLGRVMGNVMIRVVPSNLKLIDRSVRYIRSFTGLDYEKACLRLHQSIEYVSPNIKAGREYPSPVGLSIIAARDQCTLAEAETRLARETE